MASKANALLKGAKKVATTTAAKKDDKKNFTLEQNLADELRQKIVAQKMSAIVEAWEKTSSTQLKEHGLEKAIEEIKKTGISPESFILSAAKDAKSTRLAELKKSLVEMVDEVMNVDDCGILFGMQDKYITVDEKRVEYLISIFGEDVVDTKNEFVINADLVDEHGSKLMEFILGWKDASESMFATNEEEALAAKKKYDKKKKQAAFDKIMAPIEKAKQDAMAAIEANAEFTSDEKAALKMLVNPTFSADVKENLIQLKQKTTVKKGSIDRIPELAKKATANCGTPWDEAKVLAELKPILFLKARGKGE